jgi:hypothetical protein
MGKNLGANASLGTQRRPPLRTLGKAPLRIILHTVDTDTPEVRPASATLTQALAGCGSTNQS